VDEDDSAIDDELSDAAVDETDDCAEACDDTTVSAAGASTNDNEPAQPLLTSPGRLPVTEVQITPDQPGALLSQSNQLP